MSNNTISVLLCQIIPFLFLDDEKGFRIVQKWIKAKNVGEPIGSARLFNEGT